MELDFSSTNWYAIIVCVVVGQLFLSLWFIVIFGQPWAREYGATDKAQHAKEIPGHTYAIQILCTLTLTFGIAFLQQTTGVETLGEGFFLGVWIAIFFSLATALPGYIFLKRMKAFWLAMGSQSILILLLSLILAWWQ